MSKAKKGIPSLLSSSLSEMISGFFGAETGLCALARRVGLSSSAEVSSQVRFLPLDALVVSAVFSFRRTLQTKPAWWIRHGSQCLNFPLANLLQPGLLHWVGKEFSSISLYRTTIFCIGTLHLNSPEGHMHKICKNYPLKKCETGGELRQLELLPTPLQREVEPKSIGLGLNCFSLRLCATRSNKYIQT